MPHKRGWIELDARAAQGLEVRLLWRRSDGAVELNLLDTRAGTARVCDVPPACAGDAFRHPFAYLAARPEGDAATPRGRTPRQSSVSRPGGVDVDELWLAELSDELLSGISDLLARAPDPDEHRRGEGDV